MSDEPRTSPFQPILPEAPAEVSHWGSLHGSAKALVFSRAAARSDRPLIVLTPDPAGAARMIEELHFYADGRQAPELLSLPDWETLPYDLISPYQDIISERLATLARLPALGRGILVVPVTTAMHRFLPKGHLLSHSLILKTGQRLNLADFRKHMMAAGYAFCPQVTEHGEAAIRGSLIDLFPMGADHPYRIDLLDDEIDSIREFDPETQRSTRKTEAVTILPAKEIDLSEDGIATFRSNWRMRFEGNPAQCPVYRDVSEGFAPAGIEYYLPLFYRDTSTLFDYLPAGARLILDEEVTESAGAFRGDAQERYEQRRHDREQPLLPPGELFLSPEDLASRIRTFPAVHVTRRRASGGWRVLNFASTLPPQLPVDARAAEPLAVLRRYLDAFRGRVLLVAESAGRRETLLDLLHHEKIRPKPVTDWNGFLAVDDPLCLAVAQLEQGALIDDPKIAVIAEAQLFGERAMQRRLRRRRKQDAEAIIRNLTELNPGAPVVHEHHGVGRYRGLVTLTVTDVPAEFICIEYAQGDKLYVPVSALDLIGRYTGVDPEHAPLHRLGSGQWEKVRSRAARRIHDVAAELLELYARRAARPGMSFEVSEHDYLAFTQAFPFEETPGQAEAISAVLDDMRKAEPMDRLVCGDSGFGKTEVAMRAAFVAVQNGWQVALLVPTTLLAEQHFRNFRDRFADWPVRVEMLSRFRAGSEQQNVLAGLADGRVDIVIGTHKLIQGNVKFKRLGLLIIDEEHRFGVRQKERFKALRAEIDILTLTATPIPRTLNMALSSLRDLSIITTPPLERLAVKTIIHEWSRPLVREALLREIRRGGQVYFLHNEIKSIERQAEDIRSLMPEARVRVAHGRMPEKELEQVMLDFYHRRFNILVCTSIIETGIDVPTANTIIVNRADKFGLAQLYQLRGRVGRSHHRAFAYMIVPVRNAMTQDAVKRLEAIESLEELGVGFTLATHDLEIRGAGEILGEEQSGQIQEIGFGLYMDLLERAIQALKAGRQPELDRPLEHGAEIDLHVPALIPEDYLPDVHARLIMYKRIASARNEDELQGLREEMIDRFGLLPEPARNLFRITSLKLRANPLGVRRIDLGRQGGRLHFHSRPAVDPKKILALVQAEPQTYKLDGPDKLRITRPLPETGERFRLLDNLLEEISARNAA